jgi:hypothetical protein
MRGISTSKILAVAALATMGCGSLASAAFIVEGHPTGKANANFTFDTAPGTSTTPSTAVGLQGTGSRFGGTGTAIDNYYFSYTPGTNADNTVFTLGTDLGNSNASTGLVGGVSGTYNVYFTTPLTASVTSDSTFTITSDDANVVQVVNTGNTLAENAWLLLATVDLTAGTTYTVTQTSGDSSFTSQRSHGVMWELVTEAPVPEPATAGLLLIGGAALALRRRRQA